MPTTSLINKCQEVLGIHMAQQSFTSSTDLRVTDPYGHQLANEDQYFPVAVVAATSSEEYPEQSGNFFVNMEVRVFGALDPANADSYATNVSNHTTHVGNVYNYLYGLEPLNLNDYNAASGDLVVDDIRIGTQETGINQAEGVLEDIFDLRIYCHLMGTNG